jgi:hypothetical protein
VDRNVTHHAFGDETKWNEGRFRGVGLLTLSAQHSAAFEAKAGQLLQESSVKELKWKGLKTARERHAAIKITNLILKGALAGECRVDVLSWDTHDKRHKIQGRDDLENLQRMYYHLLRTVLRKRWPSGSRWGFYPDEHTGIDWAKMEDFLGKKSSDAVIENNLLTFGQFHQRIRHEFQIEHIDQRSSAKTCLIQAVDIFVGLAVYTRDKGAAFYQWDTDTGVQKDLFETAEAKHAKINGTDEERFQLLRGFLKVCRAGKMGVSFVTKKCLHSPNPGKPINFWHYEPQHELDVAPTRKSKQEKNI